jgi:hypothetical protein
MADAAAERAEELADGEISAACQVDGALEHGVIGVGRQRQRIGQRLVELECGRIDLQHAGEAREAVLDRDEFPKFILPPFRLRFGAADHRRQPGQNDDGIARPAISDRPGPKVAGIGRAFLDRLGECEDGFRLRGGMLLCI